MLLGDLAAIWKCRGYAQKRNVILANPGKTNEERCLYYLYMTSRSFAVVIDELHPDLRMTICVFYLVLRGLDTIEDDMTIPMDKKAKYLIDFYRNLTNPNYIFLENGPDEADRELLVNFDVVLGEFAKLDAKYQEIIIDITRKMGAGMAEFLGKPIQSMTAYNQYAHYVAGLVGIGLSGLFAASGLEDQQLGQRARLSNSLGLLLQKTNIIRDIHEDTLQQRYFWPGQVWKGHLQTATDPKELLDHVNRKPALAALNQMIYDAFGHFADMIEYLSCLRNESVFRFCAICQVMAVATLAECYNNTAVFERNVKISKRRAARIMIETKDMDSARHLLLQELIRLERKLDQSNDRDKMQELVESMQALCFATKHSQPTTFTVTSGILVLVMASGLFWRLAHRK